MNAAMLLAPGSCSLDCKLCKSPVRLTNGGAQQGGGHRSRSRKASQLWPSHGTHYAFARLCQRVGRTNPHWRA